MSNQRYWLARVRLKFDIYALPPNSLNQNQVNWPAGKVHLLFGSGSEALRLWSNRLTLKTDRFRRFGRTIDLVLSGSNRYTIRSSRHTSSPSPLRTKFRAMTIATMSFGQVAIIVSEA